MASITPSTSTRTHHPQQTRPGLGEQTARRRPLPPTGTKGPTCPCRAQTPGGLHEPRGQGQPKGKQHACRPLPPTGTKDPTCPCRTQTSGELHEPRGQQPRKQGNSHTGTEKPEKLQNESVSRGPEGHATVRAPKSQGYRQLMSGQSKYGRAAEAAGARAACTELLHCPHFYQADENFATSKQ